MRLIYVKHMFTKDGQLTIINNENDIVDTFKVSGENEIQELAMFCNRYDADDLILNTGIYNKKIKQHLLNSSNILFSKIPNILLFERKGDNNE